MFSAFISLALLLDCPLFIKSGRYLILELLNDKVLESDIDSGKQEIRTDYTLWHGCS